MLKVMAASPAPAVDDRAEVHGDQVALGQGSVVRDAVHDLVVDRHAGDGREGRHAETGAVVQEGRAGAVPGQAPSSLPYKGRSRFENDFERFRILLQRADNAKLEDEGDGVLEISQIQLSK